MTVSETNGVVLAVVAVFLVGLPVIGILVFAHTGHRTARLWCAVLAVVLLLPSVVLLVESSRVSDRARRIPFVRDPGPACQVHSGSKDVCPGG